MPPRRRFPVALLRNPALVGRGPSSAPSFNPAAYGTVLAWWSPEAALWQDTAGMTPAHSASTPVARWDDASGHGRHLTQSVVSDRPTIATTTQAGRRALTFNGVNQWLYRDDTLGLAANAPRTYVVVRRLASATARTPVFSQGAAEDSAGFSYTTVEANTYSTAGSRLGFYACGASYDQDETVTTAWGAEAHAMTPTVGAAITATTVVRTVAGARTLTPVNTGGGSGAWLDLAAQARTALGRFTGLSIFGASDVGEVIVYSEALPDATMGALMAELASRWGLS